MAYCVPVGIPPTSCQFVVIVYVMISMLQYSTQSFRNLGNVLEETRRLSLSDDNNNSRSVYKSFRNLNEAMAIAIQNSLTDSEGGEERSLFKSFCNLDGVLKQAAAVSLKTHVSVR